MPFLVHNSYDLKPHAICQIGRGIRQPQHEILENHTCPRLGTVGLARESLIRESSIHIYFSPGFGFSVDFVSFAVKALFLILPHLVFIITLDLYRLGVGSIPSARG